MKVLSTALVLGLCGFHASAQDALTVDVLSGQDAIVTAATGKGADFRVRVLDRDRKPVQGATVSAVLPAIGVGGHFRGGNTIDTQQTNSQGEAEFTGIHVRKLTGDFTTRVLARSGDRTGTTNVVQKVSTGNRPAEGWTSRRRLVMLGIAGAGVAAAIVVATYGNGSSTQAAGFSVTPGNPVTTGPR
jgi:hypothetical protein